MSSIYMYFDELSREGGIVAVADVLSSRNVMLYKPCEQDLKANGQRNISLFIFKGELLQIFHMAHSVFMSSAYQAIHAPRGC